MEKAPGRPSRNLDGIVTLGDETYSSVKTAQHEINEVLGVGGWGTILGDDQIVNEKTTIAMLDPYRYSAANTRSLTLDTTATAYLSFDKGLTNIANFNQSGNNSDYGDLTASPCYVQSYQGCAPFAPETLTSPEGLMLQAVGYDPANSPRPSQATPWLLGAGCCSSRVGASLHPRPGGIIGSRIPIRQNAGRQGLRQSALRKRQKPAFRVKHAQAF